MRSLGDLGVTPARPEAAEPVTFGWFGATIRVREDFTDVDLVDLMEEVQGLRTATAQSLAFIKGALRRIVDDDQPVTAMVDGVPEELPDPGGFTAFWRLARENRQTEQDLIAVFWTLVSEMTDRPTRRPSDSSDGPPTTATSSEAGSTLPPVPPGRPDLVVIREDSVSVRDRVRQIAG